MYLINLVLVLSFASYSFGQDVVFEYGPTALPTGLVYHSAIYDGEESVYLLGGDNPYRTNEEIFKYTVSNASFSVVARFPTPPFSYGCAVRGLDGAIYYFGGSSSPDVWRFDPKDNSVEIIATLPYPQSLRGATAVTENGKEAIIFGYPSVLKFDMETRAVTVLNEHKSDLDAATAWAMNEAYICGGAHRNTSTGDYYSNEIWRYTPSTNKMELLQTRLPLKIDMSNGVWDGRKVYIIGGYGESVNQVITFDPFTETATLPNVLNFPQQFFAAASVYVDKLDRIYTFGGGSQFGPKNSVVFFHLSKQ